MDKLHEHSKKILDMMAKEKIVLLDGPKFRLNPSFIEIINSQFKMNTPAMALTLAIRSYCPEASWNEIAVLAGGVLRTLEMIPEESKITTAIKDSLNKEIPLTKHPTIQDLDKIMKKINQEHSLK